MTPFLKWICSQCGHSDEPCVHYENRELKKSLRLIEGGVLELIRLALRQTGFFVSQLQGENLMPITGIVAGSSGVFQETPTPQGATIPAGSVPVWASSDSTVTLTPFADGTQVTAAVPAGSTITTFNLSVANQDGSFQTSVAVPVTQAAVAQTGFQIDQVS